MAKGTIKPDVFSLSCLGCATRLHLEVPASSIDVKDVNERHEVYNRGVFLVLKAFTGKTLSFDIGSLDNLERPSVSRQDGSCVPITVFFR